MSSGNIQEDLNTTISTAAEHNMESLSWLDSPSRGRVEEKSDALSSGAPRNPCGPANPGPSNKLDSDTATPQTTNDVCEGYDVVSKFRKFVNFQAWAYLNSFPGPDNSVKNTTLHSNLKVIQDPNIPIDLEALEAVQAQVSYRLAKSARATWFVEAPKLPKPDGKNCEGWDEAQFRILRQAHPNSNSNNIHNLAVRKIFGNVLPKPTRKQGHEWNKANRYIAAAIAYDRTVKTPKDIDDRVALLENLAAEDIKRVNHDLDCISEIRSRKRNMFFKMGKRVRSFSSDEIRHKCASTGAVESLKPSEDLSARE